MKALGRAAGGATLPPDGLGLNPSKPESVPVGASVTSRRSRLLRRGAPLPGGPACRLEYPLPESGARRRGLVNDELWDRVGCDSYGDPDAHSRQTDLTATGLPSFASIVARENSDDSGQSLGVCP